LHKFQLSADYPFISAYYQNINVLPILSLSTYPGCPLMYRLDGGKDAAFTLTV